MDGKTGLGFLTCIPGTWTATGEWAMKATAAPQCFCVGGALGWDWLLLQGYFGGPPRVFDPGLEGHTEVGLLG